MGGDDAEVVAVEEGDWVGSTTQALTKPEALDDAE